MISVKDFLNGLAFLFTIFLLGYGFTKGYDLVELTVYNLYFTAAISSQLMNLFGGKY